MQTATETNETMAGIFDEPIKRLRKDLKESTKLMSPAQIRYLVDLYYQIQDFRIRAAGQKRAMKDDQPHEEPIGIIEWIFEGEHRIELAIKGSLDYFSDNEPSGMGEWAKRHVGVGSVISSGLVAHIEMEPWRCRATGKKKKCSPKKPHGPACGFFKIPTVGHVWRFAGMDPTSVWNKGEKRPWNAKLKVICYKLGESFVKTQNRDGDVYGHLFAERKRQEIERNFAGEFADQARAILKKKKFKPETEAFQWYSGCLTLENAKGLLEDLAAIVPPDPSITDKELKKKDKARFEKERRQAFKARTGEPGSGVPMLPPAHIHARARRWVVKIFLYHWFAEAYRRKWNEEPPKPWIIEHGGHVHMI